MEIFTQTKIDFLGKTKYFVGVSLCLLAAGAVSLVMKGGPRFGVDFKGGTLVYIKFQEAPRVGEIRQALEADGLQVAALQPFEEAADDHELKVDLDLSGEEGASSAKDRVISALKRVYPGEEAKLDFNNTDPEALADRLLANEEIMNSALSLEEMQTSVSALLDFRDKERSGLVRDAAELGSVEGVHPDIAAALAQETYLGSFAIRGASYVGPKIGKDLQWQAVKATFFALGGMLVYIAFRFEWVYGFAAVVAVLHDVLITIGFFSIFNREIELTVIAGFLTVVGYSMNDTIVIFDRVRENRKLMRRQPLEGLLNLSVNQTLSRTFLTSGLTLVAVLCLFFFGGEVLRGFSFALVVGVLVGTYSSIFVASPILLWWQGVVQARGGQGRRRR